MHYHIEVGSRWPYVLDEVVEEVLSGRWLTLRLPLGNPYVVISRIGVLQCRAGYAWDGPSGPAVDTASFMRASLVHDALYQLIREGYVPKRPYRRLADTLMRQIAEEDGMPWLRRWWTWAAVRLWGWLVV